GAIVEKKKKRKTRWQQSRITGLNPFTTKLLSSCCKMSDLMEERITSRFGGCAKKGSRKAAQKQSKQGKN
uniref:Uncharacterized protein n=1 Tax=Poecilia mexicana TaxID=48701 RepID=A0A3B3X6G9_9TELE